MDRLWHRIFLFLFLMVMHSCIWSQFVPSGISYQTVVRNTSGIPMTSQTVNIRFSFYLNSPTGTLIWQEDQLTQTDAYGLARIVIGTGINTGAGAVLSFDQVDWRAGAYYLKISLDHLGGTLFNDMGTSRLFSVPYSFHSKETELLPSIGLSDLQDVNLAGVAPGKLLKWNGINWVPAFDNQSDTVLYAYESNFAVSADTALFSYSSPLVDSVPFAFYSSASDVALNSQSAQNSDSSVYSDTAGFAASSRSWGITGNTLGVNSYGMGSIDNVDLVFRTANTNRLVLNSTGNLSAGTISNIAQVDLTGNDGLVFVGTFGTGVTSGGSVGTQLCWLPSKASFRAGGVDIPSLMDSLGIYSVAFGYNTKAGKYSFASGDNCSAADYTIAMGRKCQAIAYGAYPVGSGVALGDSSLATNKRCVAIGRGNLAALSSTVAIGSYNKSTGAIALALGTNCTANGYYSVAMGFNSSTNLKQGSFMYADASSPAVASPTLNNQFVVRAAGGTIFYSDPLQTMGVQLFPGAGSWSTVSDRNKKANIKVVDYAGILKKISEMDVSSWKYKSQARGIRHVGPMAQDFYSAFGYGDDNITISTIDADGIILAGIKALNIDITRLEKTFSENEETMKKLKDFSELESRITALENKMKEQELTIEK